MALINCRNISLAFGLAPLFSGVDFALDAGERVCLIGRNGEGKSTLFKLITEQIQPDDGEIVIDSRVKIAMLEQDIPYDHGKVYDVVIAGAGKTATALQEYHQAMDACTEGDMAACERMTGLQQIIDDNNGWDLERKANALINKIGLDPEADLASLSGGRKRRVLLAKALLSEPDILLLDEPTNHLDVTSIAWLEQFLLDAQGLTLMFISHDRAFIDKMATRIVELDRGVLRSYDVRRTSADVEEENNQEVHTGYARYQELKEQQLAAEEKQNANFDKKLAEEEVWIRQGIKARRTRNEGRVRALEKMRQTRSQRRERIGDASIAMADGALSGKLVCKVKNLNLSYGDGSNQQILVKDFSTTVVRGDKIGIIGANGVGKSTLIHAILGHEQAGINKTGSVTLGTNLDIAFMDQLRDQLDLEQSIVRNVSEGSDFVEVNGSKKHIIGYLQDFLFTPERARTPVKALSGGERNRVLLAKQLLKPANVLVLDEPTNDLDMATLELLEEAVSSFNGTVLLISHDRTFMDNVVTSTWVFEGDGQVSEYVGGYQDYLRQTNRPIDKMSLNAPSDSNTPKPAKEPTDNNTTTATTASKKSSKKKLGYKEQQELTRLPEEIAALEHEQAELQEKLADGSWFNEDMASATAAATRLSEIDDLLLAKLERWTQLETNE